MKKTHLIILIMFACLSVSAQKKMTDREFEGYKGAVKSVLNEYMEIVNSNGSKPDKTRGEASQYFFDKNGRLSEVVYRSSNRKVVFTVVDGLRTFKSFELKKETKALPKFGIISGNNNDKPIEEPEKLTPPDKRFNEKFIYEYDSQGRIVRERNYLNNNRLIHLNTFNYDAKERIAEKKMKLPFLVQTTEYKYDDNGNEIENIEESQSNSTGNISKSRYVYNDYRIDEKGNWTERKRTFHFVVSGEPKVAELMEYRTIVYY